MTKQHVPLRWFEPVAWLRITLILLGFNVISLPAATGQRVAATPVHSAVGQRGVIASVQPIATAAGMRAFEDGGNAVDAAIATALMLGVVDSHNSGLGGGCFILIRKPDGALIAIDGREMAPQAAKRDMYLRQGKVDSSLSVTGPLAPGVPGALAAYDMALRKCGRLKLASRMRFAAGVAERGYPIDRVMARNIGATVDAIRQFPATRAILLSPDDQPLLEGQLLVQTDLARTYRAIADQGLDWFYGGEFAQTIERWMSQHGGLLNAEDFRRYVPKQRTPIVTSYRDVSIIGFPPPSSGGVHVAQILNMLEGFDLRRLFRDDQAAFYHVVAEAMKLAFADRAHWLGDADHVPVPRGLIDKGYARTLAKRIQMDRVTSVASHGLPPEWESNLYGKHTTHIAAADEEGFWVAITATINTSFGSKVIVPGTGLVLNNEMDDFSAQPGVPNAFGLVGSDNNAIAPGKRPLSSMSPTLVMRDGRPILAVGAAGGPKIITQVLLAIIRAVDLDMPLERCIAEKRLHHQWKPDRLMLEPGFPPELVQQLEARGHAVEWLTSAGVSQAIGRRGSGFVGVHDPRVPGAALGF